MNSAILLISILVGVAPVDGSITPLFETDSITAYNRWLWQHRSEYPAFRPTRAQATVITGSSGWTRPVVTFWTDSGTVLSRYAFPDSWDDRRMVQRQAFDCYAVEDGDYLSVYHRGSSTAKYTAFDRFGRKLFDSRRNIIRRFGRWFSSWGPRDSIEMLDDSGDVIGALPSVSIGSASSLGDTLIAASSGRTITVFDHNARIVWQGSPFGGAFQSGVISPDERRVAIVAEESLGIQDLATGNAKVLRLDRVTAAYGASGFIAWSEDSRRFALYRINSEVPDSAMLWVFTRDGKMAGKPRTLETNYARHMFWMGDTVVLVAAPFLPSPREWMYDKPYQNGPCKVIAVPPRGKTQTWIVPGRFGQYQEWQRQGRQLAYVERSNGHAVVFRVPAK
jgi:hypothetical protein